MVYLAKDYKSGLIKIGYSANPNFREKTLRSENPQIVIIYILFAGISLEKSLHKEYRDFRVRGEWFDLNKPQIQEIISKTQVIYEKSEDSFISLNAERLLELIKESNTTIFELSYLANNILCDLRDIKGLIEELKNKKLIKYKWKDKVDIKLL